MTFMKWGGKTATIETKIFICPQCDGRMTQRYPFCPHCGAYLMVEEEMVCGDPVELSELTAKMDFSRLRKTLKNWRKLP